MANLLKYFDGALPGRPQKRKPTEEQKKETKKRYEEKRDRKFLDIWKKDRPWLKYDLNLKRMTCEWCVESGSDQHCLRQRVY